MHELHKVPFLIRHVPETEGHVHPSPNNVPNTAYLLSLFKGELNVWEAGLRCSPQDTRIVNEDGDTTKRIQSCLDDGLAVHGR